VLDAWERDPEFRGEFNDFGQPLPDNTERFARGFIDSMHGTLLIESGAGDPIGTVDWRPVMYGPPPDSMAYQFGISLIPTARGNGYGPAALRELVSYLFEHTTVNRIEGSCDVENRPSQRMMEKAGFRFEGVNRGAQFRRGAFHDLMLFAVTRDDSRA
jgi:RimJ/RimL family protein N-acetyltransferase